MRRFNAATRSLVFTRVATTGRRGCVQDMGRLKLDESHDQKTLWSLVVFCTHFKSGSESVMKIVQLKYPRGPVAKHSAPCILTR
jgi:hypothetical protein